MRSERNDENGAAIPLDGQRHQSPGLRRLRMGTRPSEHEVHKWWCDHVEWTFHQDWSTSQSALALSSGEAELYAMTKVAVQLSGVISMAKDFGVGLTGVVKSDSSSAVGKARRDGLGRRCRHIKVQYLWIQSKIKDKDVELQKILGTNNVADAMTEALNRLAVDKYLTAMNCTLMPGRADKASRAQKSGASS